MLILIIVLAFIGWKLYPVVGETGLIVIFGVVGFFGFVFSIIRGVLGGGTGHYSGGGGYSIDELELFDMMDED